MFQAVIFTGIEFFKWPDFLLPSIHLADWTLRWLNYVFVRFGKIMNEFSIKPPVSLFYFQLCLNSLYDLIANFMCSGNYFDLSLLRLNFTGSRCGVYCLNWNSYQTRRENAGCGLNFTIRHNQQHSLFLCLQVLLGVCVVRNLSGRYIYRVQGAGIVTLIECKSIWIINEANSIRHLFVCTHQGIIVLLHHVDFLACWLQIIPLWKKDHSWLVCMKV